MKKLFGIISVICILSFCFTGCSVMDSFQKEETESVEQKEMKDNKENEKEDKKDSEQEEKVSIKKESDESEIQEKQQDKTENETYLDTMVYKEFMTESIHNEFSAYTGEDCHGNQCKRAIEFNVDYLKEHYPDEIQETGKGGYYVSYDLGGEYKTFSATLTPGGNFFSHSADLITLKIYADDELLYAMGINEDTAPTQLEYDLTGKSTLKIQLETLFAIGGNNTGRVILSDAKLTK